MKDDLFPKQAQFVKLAEAMAKLVDGHQAHGIVAIIAPDASGKFSRAVFAAGTEDANVFAFGEMVGEVIRAGGHGGKMIAEGMRRAATKPPEEVRQALKGKAIDKDEFLEQLEAKRKAEDNASIAPRNKNGQIIH